jgi:hypothetical protein
MKYQVTVICENDDELQATVDRLKAKASTTVVGPPDPVETPLAVDGCNQAVTLEAAGVELRKYLEANGRDKCVELLGRFGATRLPEVPEGKLSELMLAMAA